MMNEREIGRRSSILQSQHEITTLLEEGRVLSRKDLAEIVSKYGLPSYLQDSGGLLGNNIAHIIGPRERERRYRIGNTEFLAIKYKGHLLFRHAYLPIGETNWDEVTTVIDMEEQQRLLKARQARQ